MALCEHVVVVPSESASASEAYSDGGDVRAALALAAPRRRRRRAVLEVPAELLVSIDHIHGAHGASTRPSHPRRPALKTALIIYSVTGGDDSQRDRRPNCHPSERTSRPGACHSPNR